MENRQQILQAQRGDNAAFEALVTEHAQFVYNLALRIVRDPHEAEDLAQEAFVRIWRALPSYRAEASFRTWLYRIVTNVCYDRLPGLKRDLAALPPEDAEMVADAAPAPEQQVLQQAAAQEVGAALAGLPPAYRLLLTLRHMQGLSYDEIAAVTRQPLGTVKTGIHRARRMLKERLEKPER